MQGGASTQRNGGGSQATGIPRMGVMENGPNIYNHGFDNEQQEYIVIMNEHISYRYELVKRLGKGSFGIVLRAFDHKTKEFVALKILKN
jgi:serine/threonine protein kinase